MSDCKSYVSKEDLQALKESQLHIEHVARSRNAAGDKASQVTDSIRGENVTNRTLDGLEDLYTTSIDNFEARGEDALRSVGWVTMDSFQQGAEITERNQVLRDETNGEYYRWDGDLPKYVPAGSTPESSGGVSMKAWVSVGDASLRSELDSLTVGLTTATKSNNNYVSDKTSGTFYCLFKENSFQGDTFNGKPLKILDVYATEQSQWTINGFNNAQKNKPKVPVYRSVFQNAISADVRYVVVAHDDFYEVIVDKIYKHAFILCGRDREFTELQDAINFTSQFNKSFALDPMWLRVDQDTDYFPNLAQITIAIQSGTPSEPVINQMSKAVRVGQNNMAGIEIVNENRYRMIGQNDAKKSCIVEYVGDLNSDDLAFLNFWKCDISEVWGITFKFQGEFNHVSQGVVRYNRTASQFKNCDIDLSNATFTGAATTVYGYFSDRENENFNCKVICPSGTNPVTAIRCRNSIMGSWEITGKPKFALEFDGICQFSGLKVESCEKLINYYSNSMVTFDDASSSLQCDQLLKDNPYYSLKIFIQGSIPTSSNINFIKGKNIEVSNNTIINGDTSCLISGYVGGVDKWSIGQGTSQSGLNFYISGNRLITLDNSGNYVPAGDGTQDLGYSSRRIKNIFLANQPSVTSDERLKTDLTDVSEKLKKVAKSINIVSFKYKDRVKEKGDKARTHFGVSAQQVINAFSEHGLDAFDFACVRIVDDHYEVVLDEILALKMSVY